MADELQTRVYTWLRHDGWAPAGTNPGVLPLHAGCGILASMITLFVILLRHSPIAVCVLVGACIVCWWAATHRPVSYREENSPAFVAAWGFWLMWTIMGLLWNQTEYGDDDAQSWTAYLFFDLLIPGVVIACTTTTGYTNAQLQSVAYILLLAGTIMSSSAAHAFGMHGNLLHVMSAALRVLVFFGAFLFVHYFRTELPFGHDGSESDGRLRYPEYNRYTAQDRTSLILTGWLLLCQWSTMTWGGLMAFMYIKTTRHLARQVKQNTDNGKVLRERWCACGRKKPDLEAPESDVLVNKHRVDQQPERNQTQQVKQSPVRQVAMYENTKTPKQGVPGARAFTVNMQRTYAQPGSYGNQPQNSMSKTSVKQSHGSVVTAKSQSRVQDDDYDEDETMEEESGEVEEEEDETEDASEGSEEYDDEESEEELQDDE